MRPIRPWLVIPCLVAALLVIALAAWDLTLIRQAFAPACRAAVHRVD